VDRSERIERRFEIPVLIAALLVIPVIVIEQSDLSDLWKLLATVLNWLIWLVFLAELVTLLAVAPNRWAWLRRHPLELAIVVLTPPFLPTSLQAARVFRLFRVLRLFRLMKIVRRLFSPEGLRDAAVFTAMTALGGGAAFAAVENKSTWQGVYWAVTTMTTVGYGDLSPKTDGGKAIAVVVMLIGIGFLTLVIGAIAQRFLVPSVEEIEEVEREAVEEFEEGQLEVLAEVREIRERLGQLERRLAQRAL
jgi:voltage-gated potassium channel